MLNAGKDSLLIDVVLIVLLFLISNENQKWLRLCLAILIMKEHAKAIWQSN